MSNISTWSTTAASNNSPSPDGFPEGMAPSGVNDSLREMMAAIRTWYESAEWISLGHTPTYASSTTFTLTGNQTSTYHVNRRIKCTDLTTLYGVITGSTYSSSTTVTVSLLSGSLSASLTAVALGPAFTNQSTPAFVDTNDIVCGGTDSTKRLKIEVDGLTTGTTRTMTIPDASFVAVGTATTQTLTNKTINTSLITLDAGKVTNDTTSTAGGNNSLANIDTASARYNTAYGASALNAATTANSNVAIGYQSLLTSSNASSNVAVGNATLRASTSCSENVAIGASTCYSNTTGYYNSAVGAASLYYNSTGSNNTSNGYHTLFYNTASNNVAIGASTCYLNTTGTYNSAVGTASQYSNSTGSNNTSIGYRSLYNNTANSNTAVGANSGISITSGGDNTCMGYTSGSNITTGTNDICIGYNAQPTAATVSNEITLGNSSISTLRCQVTTITALSDERDKKDIEELPVGLDFINAINPVQFTWDMRDGGKVGEQDTGFIAQQLQKVQDEFNYTVPGLVYDSNPDRLEAGYGKLIPVLVKAIQDLSNKIEMLESSING